MKTFSQFVKDQTDILPAADLFPVGAGHHLQRPVEPGKLRLIAGDEENGPRIYPLLLNQVANELV
jgi:hypothetical protein